MSLFMYYLVTKFLHCGPVPGPSVHSLYSSAPPPPSAGWARVHNTLATFFATGVSEWMNDGGNAAGAPPLVTLATETVTSYSDTYDWRRKGSVYLTWWRFTRVSNAGLKVLIRSIRVVLPQALAWVFKTAASFWHLWYVDIRIVSPRAAVGKTRSYELIAQGC